MRFKWIVADRRVSISLCGVDDDELLCQFIAVPFLFVFLFLKRPAIFSDLGV